MEQINDEDAIRELSHTEYPSTFNIDPNDSHFLENIMERKEYLIHRDEMPEGVSTGIHNFQMIVKNFISPFTPYKSLLLFWSTGTGKTIASLVIAEAFQNMIMRRNIIGEKAEIQIVTKNEEIHRQFVSDLLKVTGNKYLSVSEKNIYTQYDLARREHPTEQNTVTYNRYYRKLLKKLNYFGYTFTTYTAFRLRYKGTNVQEKFTEANNSLVIFDEAHNIEHNKALKVIARLKRNSTGLKLLFMTATPMSTYPYEIVPILNLLRSDIHEVGDFFDSEHLKKGALDKIGKLSRGYVSYYSVPEESTDYPKKYFLGKVLTDFGFKKLKLIQTVLSKYHYKTIQHYVETTSTSIEELEGTVDTINTTKRGIMNMILPNPASDKCGLTFYEMDKIANSSEKWKEKVGIVYDSLSGSISGDFLKYENLQKYSCKYHQMLTDIFDILSNQNTTGAKNILIYHNLVEKTGVLMLAEILSMNGFLTYESQSVQETTRCYFCGKKLIEHNRESHDFSPAKFILFYGNILKETRIKYINIFNSKRNIDGKIIKIIIGNIVISEGIEFHRIRSIHFMQALNSLNMEEQVIGRAVRYRSHNDLPIKHRNVVIYRYCNIFPYNRKQSTDAIRYLIQEKRQIEIKSIENALITNSLAHGYFINEQKMRFKPPRVAKSIAFNEYFYNDEVKIYEIIIRNLFGIYQIWTYDNIEKQVSRIILNTPLYAYHDYRYLALALYQMIQEKEARSFYVNRINGYIIKRGKYYIFQPTVLSETAQINERLALINSNRNQETGEDIHRSQGTLMTRRLVDITELLEKETNAYRGMSLRDILKHINASDSPESIISDLDYEKRVNIIKYALKNKIEGINEFKEAVKKILKYFKPILINKERLTRNSYDIGRLSRDTGTNYIGAVFGMTSMVYENGQWKICSEFLKTSIQPKIKLNKVCGLIDSDNQGNMIFKVLLHENDIILPQRARDFRKVRRGQICSNFSKSGVLEVLRELNINIDTSDTTINLCDIIQQKLYELDTTKRVVMKKRFYIDYLELEILRNKEIISF